MRVDPDFSEDTVSIAIATYLAVLSFPQLRFSIEPFSRKQERWIGADARLMDHVSGIYPFYMQFKRPHAYADYSRAKIIKDRKALTPPLNVGPRTLYFDLRQKQPDHSDYQHNILYRLNGRLRARGLGDAAYVCPLFLTRQAYMHHAHMSGLRRLSRHGIWYPYDYEDIVIADSGTRMNFNRIPFLEEHVTIPPHDKVDSAKHSYSFLENGSEICFHSPLAIPEGSQSLGTWLSTLGTEFLRPDSLIRPETASEQLAKLLETGSEVSDLGFQSGQAARGLESWLAWGDYLSRNYSIEQYAFIAYEA